MAQALESSAGQQPVSAISADAGLGALTPALAAQFK
jgi:hypothetical protein